MRTLRLIAITTLACASAACGGKAQPAAEQAARPVADAPADAPPQQPALTADDLVSIERVQPPVELRGADIVAFCQRMEAFTSAHSCSFPAEDGAFEYPTTAVDCVKEIQDGWDQSNATDEYGGLKQLVEECLDQIDDCDGLRDCYENSLDAISRAESPPPLRSARG